MRATNARLHARAPLHARVFRARMDGLTDERTDVRKYMDRRDGRDPGIDTQHAHEYVGCLWIEREKEKKKKIRRRERVGAARNPARIVIGAASCQ